MIEIASAARGRGRPAGASAPHALLLLLVLVGLWLMMAPAAHAGEWTQVTCSPNYFLSLNRYLFPAHKPT